MRRSEGYTDKLEKLTRDDSGLAAVVNPKDTAQKKMRLWITGFSQSEYWHVFLNKGYIMTLIFQKKMNCKFANLKLALKKYIHLPKWEEENALVEEEKGEEANHTFIKIEFILGRDVKWVKELFPKFWPTCYKTLAT